MVLKDKPILLPLRIFRPSTYASGELFPFRYALAWWIAIQALAFLEPVPAELDIQFNWKYLAFQHLCAIAAQILLPLAFVPFLSRDLPGGRVRTMIRLSFGACFWYLWTFPLAFLANGVPATLALELGRPLLWAGTVAWVAGGLRTPKTRAWSLVLLGTPGLFLGCILVSLVPDLGAVSHLKMDDVKSGRICAGVPELPPGFVQVAQWDIHGPAAVVDSERLSLGGRQQVRRGAGSSLQVVVTGLGSIPAPYDTTGSRDLANSDGKSLLALVDRVPPGNDSLRLLVLHSLVHGSIRYQRTYFPGTPSQILDRGTGDCKAFAQVFCSGARRLGFQAKVVHGLLASADGYYAHAWVTARMGDGRWLDWDPTSSIPFPDARYLRFTAPKEAAGAFDGELAIFSLDSVRVSTPGSGLNFHP